MQALGNWFNDEVNFVCGCYCVLCRHVVKLEKEAVDLGLVATTTTKQDEPGSSEQHDQSESYRRF